MTYDALHKWVERQLGKPMICSKCGDAKRSRYHWSNISGEYKQDLSDWQRLCVPCHKNYDYALRVSKGLPGKTLKTHCKRGHELSGENVRDRNVGKYYWRVCRACEGFYYNELKIKKEGVLI